MGCTVNQYIILPDTYVVPQRTFIHIGIGEAWEVLVHIGRQKATIGDLDLVKPRVSAVRCGQAYSWISCQKYESKEGMSYQVDPT